jgi:ATP-dependent helicase/nuclease subunit B
MKGRVEVLCGGAGSGKTRRLLGIFRDELRRLLATGTPGQAVWITPTARSRRAVRHSLLDTSLGVCFAPNVLTFDAFAERLLQTTGPGISPLSRVAQRVIVRTLIEEAIAAKSLPYFQPIAETSGFLDLVLGLIAELKRDETEPDDFAIACGRRNSPRDAELLQLYRRYQERLTELSLYDAEGRFWAARLELAAGRRGAFDPLTLLVVDGFADFTQPQYEILEHLAGYADRVLVSLPLEQPVVRTDLFAKSTKALEEISRRCRVDVAPPAALEQSSGVSPGGLDRRPASLKHLADNLFDNPRTVPRIADSTGIEIIAAAGLTGEARAVAERVKRLLLDGVSADEIVIGTRALEDDGSQLVSILEAAGIPACCESGPRFSQTAVGKALFAVLQVELEDWAFNPLCSLLRSNYFRPRWSFAAIGETVETTIRVLRRHQLGSDRQHILNRLARLAAPSDLGGKQADRDRNAAGIAAQLLRALSDATARLRSPKDLKGWCECLFSLAHELGIEPGRKPPVLSQGGQPINPLVQRDRLQWDALCGVLSEFAQVRELLDDRRPLPLAAFVRLLRDLLDSQAVVEPVDSRNRVRVIEASDIRNLDVPYLFLLGLSEASFPRGRRDDCFYSAAERREVLRKDSLGVQPSTPQQDEMLLFYSIVTRTRRRLTLSFPSVSPSGQPLFPSPYVTAVRDLFSPEVGIVPHSDLDPVPSRDRALSAEDLRLVATDELRFGRPGLFRQMAAEPALGASARGILAAAEMDACRFEQPDFTPYEGMLQNASSVAKLSSKYSAEYQFSTTQLEGYATCPFRFLLSHVLHLDPINDIEPEIDPMQRGQALHRLFADLHRPAGDHESAKAANPAELVEALCRLVAAQFAVPSEIPPYERALRAAELSFVERVSGLYSNQWEDYLAAVGEGWDAPPAPRFVELAFGNVPGEEETAAPPDPRLPYVTFGPKESAVRVRGRIDRIDVGRREGRDVFAVIDYKTRSGRQFDLKDVEAGRALQLAIYMSAMRRSGLLDPEASPFQMAYWSLTLAGCVVGLKGKTKGLPMLEPQLVGEIERTLDEVLPKIAERVREGQFPVINDNEECGKWCPYSMTCRVRQIRSRRTERSKLWSLSAQ